jgi:hypothetical protein
MPRACAWRVLAATGSYEPRDPAQSVLYHVVRDHFETFRAQAASLRDGEGLPRACHIACGTCSRGITICVAQS